MPDRLATRIWARDASLWPPGEDDPAARLGWLDLPTAMQGEIGAFRSFASEAADFEHVVLLGMGGSSLAPEVFARVLGAAEGRPPLTVLDSTHPDQVRDATDRLDLRRTLFVVSSKSGTTVETMSLFRYFRRSCRPERFVAITDPGTPLERLAREEGFRAVFTAPPDVGGRYSALSPFGLVPAALLGVDLDDLLERTRGMAELCRYEGPLNPGLELAAFMGSNAAAGRDKLTVVASDALQPVGDWIDQLVAESTGKNGRGVVPVVAEPDMAPAAYGSDRAFVFLRLAGDETHAGLSAALEAEGHPVITIEVPDAAAVGAEMFRWEFATAAACSVIGVNAFDQPDVESAKRAARSALDDAPEPWPETHPGEPFASAAAGDLACILLFAPAGEERAALVAEARARVAADRGVATSAGFGPRYLHSTGQLHKGGPPGVRALIVLDPPEADLPIPGEDHGFARLVTAQAEGDARALKQAGRAVSRTTWRAFEEWVRG